MNELEMKTRERVQANAFMLHNHIELESVEQDRAVFRLTIRPESKNPYGMVHGGAIYTLADNATGAAAHTFCEISHRAQSGRRPMSGTGAIPRF